MSRLSEAVAAALCDLMKASQEEEKAREEYEGHSWGYHGAYLIDARQRASAEFERCLTEFVDDRITSRSAEPSSGTAQE